MKRSDKVWDILNGIWEKILGVFFVLVILLGIYITLDVLYVYRNSRSQVGWFKPEIINAETLREISGDTVGWITLDETPIDYPIMQSDNNIDYLNKDPKGNYSLSGSIFMDFRCSSDFSDPYSLVYGHHMASHLMFGALDDYVDPAFAEKHQTGTLHTANGEYPVQVLSYLITKTDCDEIFNPTDGFERVAYLKQHGVFFFEENETPHLLALTTCKDPATTDRTALILGIEKTIE